MILASFSRGTGFGDPHIEVDTTHYHYVVTERGKELERKTTLDADELIYWLISDVIRDIASDYEMKHRVPNQDSRRQQFQKEIELFLLVNPDWAARKKNELAVILAEHPFSDKMSRGKSHPKRKRI